MVKGFGGTMIFADNTGEGYLPSDSPINMRRECIKSRLHSVEQYAAKAEENWGYIPKKVEKRLEKVHRFLTLGTEEAEEKAFAEVLWAGEEIVLFHAEHTIEKRGKRDNFTMEQHFQIVKDVYDVVKRLSPKTRIMINFYDEWQNKYGMDVNNNEDFIAFKKQYKLPLSPPNEYCCSIPDFLEHCEKNGVKIDLLGLQFHDFPYELFNTMELLEWWHNRYHLPIQLTELCTPSAMGKSPIRMGLRPAPANPNYWHAPWNQQIQAQWYRDFATLFYSLDYVEVMDVWSYSDAPTQWADYLEGHINEKFKLGAFAFDGIDGF